MAATCNIVPQVRTKDNRLVDSILFTNLLSSGIKRNDAISIYTKIFTSAFKREHGDWENFPNQYKGGLDINGQPSVESVLSSSFFSSLNGIQTDSLNNSARKIEGLSKAFASVGIDVEIKFDNTLQENANVQGTGKHSATITLNPDKVFADTIPHEYGHIYIDILGVNHPLVKQAIEQLKNTPLYKELKELYPELSEDSFNKELVVTAVGREYSKTFNSPESISRWNFWLTRFFRAIGEALGIKENAAKVLAMDMINQKLRKGEGSISTEIQKQKATLKDIEDKFAAEGLYLDEAEGVYKDNKKNVYKRLTEWVDTGFSKMYQDMKMTCYEANAYRIFKNKNLDTTTDKVSIKDETGNIREYSYKELVEHERMLQNTKGRIYGNIVHAIIQNTIKPSQSVQDNITRWMNGIPNESYPQNPKDFEWIENSIAKIFTASSINVFNRDVKESDRDKLSPELIVASKTLGIATTIDNLVEHSDGNLSLIDWKTGGLFTDKIIATYMRYGRNQVTNINDSKLNRAKLEVVLRAMMVKESMGDKSTRFRNLKVVHMDKKGRVTTSNIDIVPFLGIIESYFQDSANGKLEEYKKLKEQGLFDAKDYIGSNRNLESDLIDEVPSAAMEKLLGRLTKLSNSLKDNKTKTEKADIQKQIDLLVAEIGILKSQPIGVNFEADNVEDMGMFKRWFGNANSSHNPKIKAFFVMLNGRKDAARKRIQNIYNNHDELLKPIIEQYYKDHNIKGTLKKSTKYLLGGINGLQYKELFDFMWEEVEEGDRKGMYARIIKYENGKYTDGKNEYTKEQYEYNKWYRETLAAEYKKVASRVGLYRGSRAVTVGEMMNKPNELDEKFMPRYMLNAEEITERYGFLSKEHLEYQRDAVLSDFTEQEYNINDSQHGIPIKYLGNKDIIQSGNHTLSAELAFKNFISNIIMKDELDDIHSFGNGVMELLKDKTEAGEDMSNSIDFLKDQIYLHVLDIKKPSKWSRKGFTFPVTNKDGSKGTRTVSIDRIMRLLKSWVSSQAMWVKPVAAGANAALIFTLQLNKGLIGSLAKATGIPPEQLDFTMSDLIAAHKDYGTFIADITRGKKEENKMWQFAKHMNYLPDNYDYAIRKGDLLGVKNKIFDKSNLYLFHSIGEEYGSFIIMAAQLHRYKLGDKSAWDSYDIKNGKLEYTGDRNLKLDDGTQLTGLSSLEMTKLKRVSAKIHGGYRQDERTALELTAMGQWALQFRKYLPNILENLVQGKYEDLSIGNYVKKKDEDVYTWTARINEGRVRVMGKWIFTMLKMRTDDDYKWSNLPDEQKLQIYELLVSGSMWALMTAAHAAMFSDDDDDDDEVTKAWKTRTKRLIDDTTQGFAFWDILSSLQNQTTVIPKLHKTSNAAYDFLFRGVVMGEKTQDGDMVGENTLTNGLPFFSTLKEKARYFGTESNEGEVKGH